MTCPTETIDPNDPDEAARLDRIRSKHAYVTVAAAPWLDGVIEMVDAQPLRARVKRRTFFRARPEGKAPSHLLASEADARRWIEEHGVGGNPAGFIHELADTYGQPSGTESCPRCITVVLRHAERRIRRLEEIEAAARHVSSAAWTDRWSRLHGHPSIEALDATLRHAFSDGKGDA